MYSNQIRRILFLLPYILLFYLLWQKDYDLNGDLGYQITLGKIIVNCHCVPTINLFSYAFTKYPWIANSWLSCVIFYEFLIHLGKNSLLYLKLIVFSLSFSLLYIYAWKKYSKFWTFILSIPLMIIYYGRFVIRPEMFSFLMISFFLILIERYRETGKTVFIWLLIPLELIWVNLHIYFIFGIGIYLCLLFEKFIQKKIKKTHLFILLWLGLITLINPEIVQIAIFPFTIFHNYGATITENLPIFIYLQSNSLFSSPSAFIILVYTFIIFLLAISYIVLISQRKSISFYHLSIASASILFAGIMTG